MRFKWLGVAGFLLTAPVYTVFAASVSSITQLVVFGDSLSDNGNISIATHGLFPGSNYASRTIPGTDTTVSMYTNGPNTSPVTTGPFGVWIDQFATRLGVSDPQPFLAGGGGTNYAVASAETGSNLLSYYVSDQVGIYLSNNPKANPAALYTFWAGSNDILDGKNPVTAADNLYNEIQKLATSGAKNFLWLNLPDLGDSPDGKSSGQSAALNTASNAFDAEWSLDLAKLKSAGVDVTGIDIQSLFQGILTDPAAYGFTNDSSPAQGVAGANPNEYVFWDGKHPTTAAHALIAGAAYDKLAGVPEPETTALAALGLLAILADLKQRKQNRARQ